MKHVELMQIVGNNLRAYRNARGMTQEELAERVGISTSFCANIERGKKGVSMFILQDLADALGITVNHLIYEDNSGLRLTNIETLLRDKPEPFLEWIEKVIQLSSEEYYSRSK